MTKRLFTKSAFKIAMGCPTRLYYAYDPETYANQEEGDEFLIALAKGGFQVGALAKLYCGVDADLSEHDKYDEPLALTAELLKRESVTIAESAFRFGNCFVRADIVRKTPQGIDLIEVKAKSWKSGQPFAVKVEKGPDCGKLKTIGGMLPYVYDVAFQKYVVMHALAEQGVNLPVRAFLMLPDKSVDCDADKVNQYFRLAPKGKRPPVRVEPGAETLLSKARILTAFDVDDLCERIIAGDTCEQETVLHGYKLVPFIEKMSELYCSHTREFSPLSTECYKCSFYSKAELPKKADGYDECWYHGMTGYDPRMLLLEDLMGDKRAAFKNGVRFLKDVRRTNLYADSHKPMEYDPMRLTSEDRRILQVALCTNQHELLGDLEADMHGDVYLYIDGLRREMASWKFPLHMIDFETTSVALPFYSHMHPYEQVAFQFSHHVIEKDGNGYKIRHAGQWLNTDKGYFPNFDFIRALKKELDGDDGTVFRYAIHENTILNQIRNQLETYPKEILDRHHVSEEEKRDLITFIDSITHVVNPKASNKGEPKYIRCGERDMVDLCEVVSHYYYAPRMKGSVSIKKVLPAVLNGSAFLRDKYSKPIYGGGAEIESLNITEPQIWVKTKCDGSGEVEDPYKWLPEVKKYLPEGCLRPDGEEDDDDLSQVNNGGAALTAYSKIQFADLETTEALRKALLRYCELDTMAMVFIWEYFNDMCKK